MKEVSLGVARIKLKPSPAVTGLERERVRERRREGKKDREVKAGEWERGG